MGSNGADSSVVASEANIFISCPNIFAMFLPLSLLIVFVTLVSSIPMVEYGEPLEDPQQYHSEAVRAAPQKKWDRYGMGFGSDGYLYDFVKRSPKYSSPKYFGYGSDGFLYDFVKRAPRMRGPGYRKYNYGFGSDGYLYDFVKK